MPFQETSVRASSTKALQDRLHQGPIATGTYRPDHSTVPTERGEDPCVCAGQETRGATRDCHPHTGANAAQQARGLLHSLQDTEGGDRTLSQQHCPAPGIWCARSSTSTLGAQQLVRCPLPLSTTSRSRPVPLPVVTRWQPNFMVLCLSFFLFHANSTKKRKKNDLTSDKVYEQPDYH